MAKIVITSTTNSIEVVFNDYSTALGMTDGTWNKNHVKNFLRRPTSVVATIGGEVEWLLTFDGAVGTFQVDTVDGVAPTDDDDLYTKLIAMIA